MNDKQPTTLWNRRSFIKALAAGLSGLLAGPFKSFLHGAAVTKSPLYWVKQVPDIPFSDPQNANRHVGVECLLDLMGQNGDKFYRSDAVTSLGGPDGLISPDDVVLIKVNAQWKYRGATNSDVVRGLIQRILEHPDGFTGEVVLFENGQGRGSLNCDTSSAYNGDTSVRANAVDTSHSFTYLIQALFNDHRVSGKLLDPVRDVFLSGTDHANDGFRTYENVSYPCFTTDGGHRVELREGLWTGSDYSPKLKLINIPVLKTHGGCEITASLKHFYGVVSMSDGNSGIRHYGKLGQTCGKMVVSVRTPVLNIVDAIWVSHRSLRGYPARTTFQARQLLASQDPVALDYWAAKYILYPIDRNPLHHPRAAAVRTWLTQALNIINNRGGLYDSTDGIRVGEVTKREAYMQTFKANASLFLPQA
jgi:uncharacterized protein (DUF362 family)